jgi:hypothetical protein
MKTPHAIFAGLTLIAGAIAAAGLSGGAGATAPEIGRYAIAVGSNFYVVLDTATGEVSECIITGSCQAKKRQ